MPDDLNPTPTPAPEPTPAPAPNADPAPILGGNPAPADPGGDPAPQDPTPPAWREDWRDALAGKDDKLLSRLKRFANPENVFKSYLELEKKVSAGQLRPGLPDGATEEEVAAFRKTMGIPDAPDGYEVAFPEGVPASDDDKAVLDGFKKAAHDLHLPPAQAKGLFEWWMGAQTAAAQRQQETVREQVVQGLAELRSEYGADFKRNVSLANQALADHGGDKASELMGLRLADGRALGDHPDFVRFAVNLALATAGDDDLVLGESGGSGPSIEQQYKDALAVQNTDSKKYWSQDHQAKVLKLRTALDAQRSRRAA